MLRMTTPLLAALVGLFLTSAGCNGKKGKKSFAGQSGVLNQSTGEAGAEGEIVALDAFINTLYPVLTTNCSVCHAADIAPFIAASDPAAAYRALIDNSKVSLDVPENSRIVLKVADEGHSCWSGDCKEDGNTILEAVQAWAKIADIKSGVPEPKLKTSSLGLSDATQKQAQSTDPRTFVYQAESLTLTGAMVATDHPGANGGKLIGVANGANPDTLDAPEDSNDTATLTVNITEAGDYMVWARASAATDMDNGFFITVDAGDPIPWAPPITGADEFRWAPINLEDDDDILPVMPFALAAGSHTVQIFRRDAGTFLDMVAVTSDPGFVGSDVAIGSTINVLSYDISQLCGVPGTKFSIEVFPQGADAYKLKNPTITVTSGSVKIQQVSLFINNFYNPQYSTYNLVDKVVSANDPASGLLSSSSMIVVKEKTTGEDSFGFGFENCGPM